jgi:riboflavin kinase/FMN adenylyltransferase
MALFSRQTGLASVAMTFEPHPPQVLGAGSLRSQRLASPQAKLRLLQQSGVDHLAVLEFSEQMAKTEAEDFVRRNLVETLAPKHVFVGFNFHFGSGGRGNPELLRRMGEDLGFAVRVFQPQLGYNGSVVSSTSVRTALDAGQFTEALRLLGRPYRLEGLVVKGDRRGRAMGFPTANVAPARSLLAPGQGVYAGWVAAGPEGVWPAVINSGSRPTFGAGTASSNRLEAHLIGYSGELYGKPIEVLFVGRIRSEQRFASSEALREQIARDVVTARRLLRLDDRPGDPCASQVADCRRNPGD